MMLVAHFNRVVIMVGDSCFFQTTAHSIFCTEGPEYSEYDDTHKDVQSSSPDPVKARKPRCTACQHFLRVADPHSQCNIQCSCYSNEPWQLDASWTPEQWDELEQHIVDHKLFEESQTANLQMALLCRCKLTVYQKRQTRQMKGASQVLEGV